MNKKNNVISKEEIEYIKQNFPSEGGVYQIINLKNNKIYIGSSIDIRKRIRDHLYNLKINSHHSSHLQNSWNQYGSQCFQFKIIELINYNEEEYVSKKDYISFLRKREQYYLDKFHSYEREYGYNIDRYATGDSKPITEEDIKKDRVKHFTSKQFYEMVDLLCNTDMPLIDISKKLNLSKAIVKNFYEKKYRGIDYNQWNFIKRERKWKKVADLNKNEIIQFFSNQDNSLTKGSELFNVTHPEMRKILEYLNINYEFSQSQKIYQFDFNLNLIMEYNNIKEAKEICGIKNLGTIKKRGYTNFNRGNYKWSIYKDGRDIIFNNCEKIFKKKRNSPKSKFVIEYNQDWQPINYYESFTDIEDSDRFRIILRDNTEELYKNSFWRYENFATQQDIDQIIEKIKKGILPQK